MGRVGDAKRDVALLDCPLARNCVYSMPRAIGSFMRREGEDPDVVK